MEAGFAVIEIRAPQLLRAQQREKLPCVSTFGGLGLVEIVILIQSNLRADLKLLHKLIPAMKCNQFIVFSLKILEAAHDRIGETVVAGRLEFQQIGHLDFRTAYLHQKALRIATHRLLYRVMYTGRQAQPKGLLTGLYTAAKGIRMQRLPLAGFLSLLLLSLSLTEMRADPVADFQHAMATTASIQGPERGSQAEKEAIMRFENFLGHLDEQTAREQTEKVYAPAAFLNDTLKTIHGAPAIRDYFIKTAQGLDSMAVSFDDIAVSGHNYYFRWTMDTRMKHLAHGKTIRTIGVTLVRFDPEGRVLLHQDFWDSAQGVWDHVPVLGAVIRWIQSTL